MARNPNKKGSKAKQTAEKIKGTNQLELTQNKPQIEESEKDDESININQIEPKKNKI